MRNPYFIPSRQVEHFLYPRFSQGDWKFFKKNFTFIRSSESKRVHVLTHLESLENCKKKSVFGSFWKAEKFLPKFAVLILKGRLKKFNQNPHLKSSRKAENAIKRHVWYLWEDLLKWLDNSLKIKKS